MTYCLSVGYEFLFFSRLVRPYIFSIVMSCPFLINRGIITLTPLKRKRTSLDGVTLVHGGPPVATQAREDSRSPPLPLAAAFQNPLQTRGGMVESRGRHEANTGH